MRSAPVILQVIIYAVLFAFFSRNEVVFVAVELGRGGVREYHRNVFRKAQVAIFDERRAFHPQSGSEVFRSAVRCGKDNAFFLFVSLAYKFAAFFKHFFGGDIVLPYGAIVAESAKTYLPYDVVVFSPFVDVKRPNFFHNFRAFAVRKFARFAVFFAVIVKGEFRAPPRRRQALFRADCRGRRKSRG